MTRFATTVGCLGIATGCGGPRYEVYQIATATAVLTDDCWGDAGVPENEENDSTTFATGDTFLIYSAPDDVYYAQLSTGEALAGTLDGKKFVFDGEVVDHTFTGENARAIEETTVVTTEFIVNRDGRNVFGKSVTDVTYDCEGRDCGESTSCTTTTDFVGVEVDADVQFVAGSAVN